MIDFERGIADVFASLESWLVSSGAAGSMLQLSWAVLTFLWLTHVAVSIRPDRQPDPIAVFGRLLLSGGLLLSVGTLNQLIVTGFQTMRDAGSAVLLGLVGQTWNELLTQTLLPQAHRLFQSPGPWFTFGWAVAAVVAAVLLGVLLFALGMTVYLAVLFFAHLTLLLGLFLAPLAVALLATPATARWTAKWATVVVRASIVVFSVRVIHAAAIYLAIIFPLRFVGDNISRGLQSLGGDPGSGVGAFGLLILNVVWLLALMLIGTGVGVYAMLRAERLTAQFVEGTTFSDAIFAGPAWMRARLAAAATRGADGGAAPNVVGGGRGLELWAGPGGGAQEATVIRSWRGN